MSNYITADEIIRRKKYESLFDDDSYRTADEIIEAAKKRDLTEKYNNSDDRSIYYRDRTVDNPLQSTQTEAFQKLNLPDSPSYTQIKDTISSQEQQKSAAARRGKDTSAYDKAIEMLRGYADKNYGFDTNTSASDREALYADKKRELKQLQNEEKVTDKTRPVDYYSKDDIVSILKSRGASYDHTAEENADFFIKYRQHIIPHGNDDKDENARRYQGLLAVIEQSNKELPNEKIAELQSKQSAIQDELRYYEKNKQSLENLEKTPEELVKDIDSEPFDYTNVEDVKGALGAGSDADAEFFVKYRQHIIPHGNDDNDENARKYQRLLEAVNLTAKSQGARKMYSQGEEVAAVSKSGQTMNYRDLLTHKVARNRESDLTVSQEEAGNILKSLGTGSRDLTQLPTLTDKEQKAAGWYSNFKNGYHSYTYKGDVENGEVEDKSAVFSAIVTDSKGNVVRVLSPSEMEEYAQKALSTGDDPLKLQATETYTGFMGTSLAVENAKRINRLSERYFNNTDLESVVDAAISGDKYAQSNAEQYGLDVDEIRHYRYITDTQKQKQQASRDYAEWSAENVGTGALATGANILASPLKAAEFVINLGESWDNNIKANRSGGISSYRLPANYDDFVTSMTNESTEQITEGIRNSIKGNGDSAVLNWLGDVTANTYGGVASSAQSALTGLTARAIFGPGAGEVVALTVMSGEAANDAFNEVIDNGGTTSQAIMYGIASGTNEALFEKVSLDHLINVKDVIGKEGIKDIFLSALKQGGIEASEEAFTELANRFADDVINTDKSEYNRNVQKYIDEGYSDEEAKSKANLDFAGQVMASAWGGFVGGGFSTGTKVVSNTVANAVQQKAETRQAGAAIADAKNIPALIEQANAVEGSEKITTQAAKVKALYDKNGGEKITGSLKKEAGTLYNMLQDHNVDNARSASGNTVREAIRERVIAETGSDDSVAVEAVYKSEISGEKLSTMEQNALKEKSVQKVVNYVQENADRIRNDARVSTENAFANIAETAALTRTENDIFTASDDGKTYIKGQNTPVTMQKVRSVSENDMDIELTDGTVVKASNIDFGDPGVKTILSNMIDIQNDQSRSAKMSAEYVNTALQAWQQGNYSESNLGAFTHDAREIYNAANNNDKYSPKLMSQGVADMLYTAANNSKKANIAARSAKIQQKKTGTMREGTVVFDDAINESSLNPLQKVGIDTVRQLAKSTGITFHFFQSKKNAAGKYVHEKHSARDKNGNLIASPNGFYSNGEIWVDINAGNNGEGLILFTVSHELVHFMSDFAPEQFDTFAKFLFDNYANDNLTIKQAVYREMTHNTNLKYDEAYEEVVARLSEAFLRDAHLTEKSRELYNTDKNVWQKIRDGLKDIVDRIEKFFAKLSPDSELGKIGQKMVRENQEILDRFLAGVRAAADNAAYIENTTGEGGVLYDLRGYSEQQKNNWKTSKRIVVYENDTQFGGFITKAKADATYNQKMYFGAISHNLAAVIKAHTNIDVENYNLSLSASEIRKIFKSHGSEKTEAPRGQRAVTDADIIKIPSIVKGATKISTCGYYNGKPMIEFVKQENNERYTVRAVVSDKRLDLFVQTSFIGVKKGSLATPTGVQAPINTPKANSGTASINSVSQKIQNNNPSVQNNSHEPHQNRYSNDELSYKYAVKYGSTERAQRIVARAANRAFFDSKVRGKDGKLRKVYHWTNSDFFTFETGRSGKNQGQTHGDGIYVSTSPDEFSYAGSKRMELYANITNPFEMQLTDDQAREVLERYGATKHNLDKYDGLYRNHAMAALTSPIKVFDYLKEYAADNNINVSDILKQLGFDGVHDGSEWVAFDSEQLKSSDPITYDDDHNYIPLLERFNTNKSDIRYQSRDDDYLSAVNRGDMETAQRMVDEAAERAFADSKIRGEDGKLIKVYHGTDADFTVFDRTMGRSNMDIQGLFFSPWDIDAGGYGQNVRAFYLNITNPADESTGYKALNAHKGENYAGIKAREDLEKAGYDGVNNSDEEYIAFTSEQIKSADPVTYDDNGDVIPLSERFNSEEKDIRYDDNRAGDLFSGDDDLSFGEFDNISDVITRNYTTHSEAIGEVLKNTADIDIAAGKVYNIVARTLDGYNIDTDTKKKLATQLHLELENAKNGDPEEIVNRMIDTVRGVLDDAKEVNQRAVEQYNDLKAAYSGKYYLTDEQIMDLKENGYTLNDFKKAMAGKMTIVKKENAARSINGGFKDASPLSLEGIHDEIDAEEILGITRDQWDKYSYHAPVMLMKAFEKLKNNQLVSLTDISSAEDRDYIAVDLAAQFTGAVVQEKYNSRKNPYVRDLVNKFEARKKEAVKKRNAYYAEKMKEIREQRDKRVAEQLQKAKEARKNATVQRKRAELKERIRKMHKSLRDMSLNPKANKYIPSELMKQSLDVLGAINLDSGFNGERADRFRAKLSALSKTLLERATQFADEATYNTTVAAMLDDLNETIGDTPLGMMSLDQLKRVHDTLKAVQTNIRNRVQVIGDEKTRYIGDIAFKMMDEIDDAKVHKILGSSYFTKQLSPERFFNLLCGGAKNNVGKNVIYRMLDDGQLKQIELETRFTRMFEPLLADRTATEWAKDIKNKGVKALRKEANTLKDIVDIGLVDEFGNKVKITRGMMLSLYMHLMNDDNIRHVMGGGLTIPLLDAYYKGKGDKAWGSRLTRVKDSTSTARDIAKQIRKLHEKITSDTSQEEKNRIWDEIHDLEALFNEEVERGKKEYINPMRSRIEQQMTEYDREWIRTAQQFFDVESKNELNKTTYELYGFEKAVVNHYFPIHSDTAFVEQKFESIVKDMSLENMGMMKNRVRSANAIFLEDITDVINRQISNVSKYCGMVIPMANVNRILNVKTDTVSVMDSLRKYDGKANSYIEKLLGDLVGANKEEDNAISKIMAKARHGIAGASLTMNFKVAIKQAASFPTAAAELGYTPLVKALVKGGKNSWMLSRADKELIYKYSPLLAYRSMGYSMQELGDLKDSGGLVDKFVNSPKMRWAFGWIQAMDTATVGRLWYASQYYVDKTFPDLKKGSDEYYKQVAQVFNNVVERTQPNYTVMQRPELLRSTNSVTKMFTMFMTQRLQNFNIVYDTAITLNKMKSDLKNQKNGVTLQDVREARTNHARAISSQMLAAAVLVGMTFLADALMHKMNPWRDDDEELTEESITKRGLLYLGDSLVGSIAGGSELYNMMVAAFGDGTWYGLSANGFDSVDDLLTNVTKGIKEKDGKYFAKAAKSLAQISGLPLQNAVNILIATKRHTEDIQDGKFLSYESGVNRTDKQNLHRSWSAYTLGNSSDSVSIMDELKDSKVQEQIAKGKSDADAKKEAYSNLRTTVRALLREDYLKARNDYYHGDHNDADYETISLITSFMTKSGLYSKPSVQDTLDKWWKDAEAKAQEGNKTMSEYLQTDGFNLWSFMGDTVSELSSGLFE